MKRPKAGSALTSRLINLRSVLTLALLAMGTVSGVERDPFSEELRVKREAVFEFVEKPSVTRTDDRVTIQFETRGFCDCTVAIEDAKGRIVRHLASGVLGANAPAPFAKGTRKQKLVWDGKDDRGNYVAGDATNYGDFSVRVSLGLKPRLERTHYWSPHKRGDCNGMEPLLVRAAKEGVYVYDSGKGRGGNTPWLKLFDQEGRYVRTLYPFPADALPKVKGLKWNLYPPDNAKFAHKWGQGQTNLLTHGSIDLHWRKPECEDPRCAMAVGNDYVYLASRRLNRIAKPGSGKASDLDGPVLEVAAEWLLGPRYGPGERTERKRYVPTGAALSPDENWLYLTGYRRHNYPAFHQCDEYLPCVMRMPADGSGKPKVFIGYGKLDRSHKVPRPPAGALLANPMDVTCDGSGNIYVADNVKGVQVFSPEGKLLRTLEAKWPARVRIHPRTSEVWVLSWYVHSALQAEVRKTRAYGDRFDGADGLTLTRFAPMSKGAKRQQSCRGKAMSRFRTIHHFGGDMDVFSVPERAWFCGGYTRVGSAPWKGSNIRVLDIGRGKLTDALNFDTKTRKDVVQSRPPRYGRQRPYYNPGDGMLYIGEQITPTIVTDVQCFDQLVRVNPKTGRTALVDLPFDTEDLAFGPDGLAYLRTCQVVARYDSRTWREVPFDYGESLPRVTHYGLKPCATVSALVAVGGPGASHKLGGMGVNVKGNLAVYFKSPSLELRDRKKEKLFQKVKVDSWSPRLYPGRSTHSWIHVWDKHGKVLYEDAVPGVGETSDVELDAHDNVLMLAHANRVLNGKTHPNPMIDTLVKIKPHGQKIFCIGGKDAPVPLGAGARPNRQEDVRRGAGFGSRAWFEGAEWLYGGVGASARRLSAEGCHCEANSGMALDYFGRSFAPAIHRYEVVVVDPAGNAILRIGRYGNVDDGVPLTSDGGPPKTRSIGGDEVAFVSPKWMSVATDRRLFVADRGNYRIVSVKLGYHTTAKVALVDVPGSN